MAISKELYSAYREVAEHYVKQPECKNNGFSISHMAAVMPAEDGAFVEVLLWVPKVIAEARLRWKK